ncbi:MAG TPA: GPW/gp25 family protein [Rhizomicrobium sp.]|nr:GPW/gp25 family protein [Rhizomicrobium sp.]
MKPAALKGWMFAGAELGATRAAMGIVLAAAGRVEMVSDDLAIRQAIVLLLTTIPGERVMRPDYGCPLHRLMFAPNDATTAGLAIHYVRQSLLRYEPRIEIVSLDAHADKDDGALLVVLLEYRVKASGRQAQLEFGLNIGEGAA